MVQNRQNQTNSDTPLPALTAKQEKAVNLDVYDHKTDEEIAKELGIARATLNVWRKLPAYIKRKEQLRAEVRENMAQGTIADQLTRLQERDQRWQAHRRLRKKRAERFSDPARQDEDCADELATGMYKKQVHKQYDPKTGALLGEVIVPVFDAYLYKALHDDELLTAKELGDIKTKTEVSGPGGKPIQVQAEVTVVGYAFGGIADAITALLELQEAGRLPTNEQEVKEMIDELEARAKAQREGKPLPPMSEPYIPGLDALLPTSALADDTDVEDEE